MIMALNHDQYIVVHIFRGHIPRCFVTICLPTDTQSMTLSQCVVHQAAMVADSLSISAVYLARLRRKIFLQEFCEGTFADKADTSAIFLIVRWQCKFFCAASNVGFL